MSGWFSGVAALERSDNVAGSTLGRAFGLRPQARPPRLVRSRLQLGIERSRARVKRSSAVRAFVTSVLSLWPL